MATAWTVLCRLILVGSVACAVSLAAPAMDPRSPTTTNTIAPKRGSGSKILYGEAVEIVDSMHKFLGTLREFEKAKIKEGIREEEMIHYGIPTMSKKDNVGFQMPGWRRRRRRSTTEGDLVSAAYFDTLDAQADRMVQAIYTFLGDLQKVRQFYEGKSTFRDSRQYLGNSRGLSPAKGALPAQE